MLACFLHYLQRKDYLKNISIQGSGADSFTKYHFDKINVPLFDENITKEIAFKYNNFVKIKSNLSIIYIKEMIDNLGLYQLEMMKTTIVNQINLCFDMIVDDTKVVTSDILEAIKKEYYRMCENE